MSPPLYADRNIPRPLVKALRAEGFHVVESLLVTPDGTLDIEEIRQAASRGAVLLSLNYTESRHWIGWARQVASELERARAIPGFTADEIAVALGRPASKHSTGADGEPLS